MATFSYSKEALIELGREHWRQHLPKTYRHLQRNGTLEQELADSAAWETPDRSAESKW